VFLSDGESAPPRGMAPEVMAPCTEVADSCTSQHVDHCVAWHPEQDAAKTASMFVRPVHPSSESASVSDRAEGAAEHA
jgi:hypothetical protein